MARQQIRRSDPRELEDLRRADRTGAEQYLRPRPRLVHLGPDRVAHPDRAPALEAQAVDVRAGDDAQVGAPAGGAQIPGRGAAPKALAHGELEVARAFLVRPVDVGVAGDPDLLRPGDERVAYVAPHPHVAHPQGAAGAVPLVRPPLLVLGPDEVGQHVLERPAGVAELAPVVEVRG